MMTLIERAARALYNDNVERNSVVPLVADRFGGFTDSWEQLHPESQDRYRQQARTVLQAIREPSEKMIEAAIRDAGEIFTGTEVSTWPAMIDAALEEK